MRCWERYMKTCFQPYGWWIWHGFNPPTVGSVGRLLLSPRGTANQPACVQSQHPNPCHSSDDIQQTLNDAIMYNSSEHHRLLYFNCTLTRNSYWAILLKYNDILRLNSKYWYKMAYKGWCFSNATLIVGKQILNLKQKGKESKTVACFPTLLFTK